MSVMKRPKIACKYRVEWSKCGFKASKRGATYAFCTVCKTDICIAGGGKTDVDRHLKTAKHINTLSQMQVQPFLSMFMSDSRARRVEDQGMRAEFYFAKFVAQHNLLFLVADHFSCLAKVMFPDSKIAEVYSCARTKTTAIITHALAPAMRAAIVQVCRSSPFTILCDRGNDQIDKKYFAMLV